MLDCQLYGVARPGGHHLTNLLLHAAAAVVLLLALRRMTGSLWPSAWVAAVFAIHPLRVESVAWVAERKDVLSGLFFMLTLWFYARYVERPASWGRYLLVAASFALGLTVKPMLVTLPFVLLLLDYWPLGRMKAEGGRMKKIRIHPSSFILHPFARLVVEKIPLLLLAAASCLITLAAQRHADALQPLEQLDYPGRVAHAAAAYVAYLGKMLYPGGLAVFYPLPKGPQPAWEVVAATTMLAAISAAVFAARQNCPYLLFGWLWYLGTLVPVIGFVQVGCQAMADRYTYLAQIGLTMALAWGAVHLAGSWPCRRCVFAALSALVAAGLTVCAWQQTLHWRDSETLWTHTLACTTQNPIAHCNLAAALAHRGKLDEAIAQYGAVLDIQPDFPAAQTNLGNALARRGRLDEAIAHFEKALENDPLDALAHYNLGNALAGHGQADAAIVHFQKALGLASARNNWILADRIRARIRLLQPDAPAGKAP
jgi:tetratricopeptide (TPR) repeat protein